MSGEIHSTTEYRSGGPTACTQDVMTVERDHKYDNIIDQNGFSKKPLVCEDCNIKVTSMKILQRHLEGRKHKMRVERKGKTFVCDICEVIANSETQLNIHLNSAKHKQRLIKKEYGEFTSLEANSKAAWVVGFCMSCIFLNLFLLFDTVM